MLNQYFWKTEEIKKHLLLLRGKKIRLEATLGELEDGDGGGLHKFCTLIPLIQHCNYLHYNKYTWLLRYQ